MPRDIPIGLEYVVHGEDAERVYLTQPHIKDLIRAQWDLDADLPIEEAAVTAELMLRVIRRAGMQLVSNEQVNRLSSNIKSLLTAIVDVDR